MHYILKSQWRSAAALLWLCMEAALCHVPVLWRQTVGRSDAPSTRTHAYWNCYCRRDRWISHSYSIMFDLKLHNQFHCDSNNVIGLGGTICIIGWNAFVFPHGWIDGRYTLPLTAEHEEPHAEWWPSSMFGQWLHASWALSHCLCRYWYAVNRAKLQCSMNHT